MQDFRASDYTGAQSGQSNGYELAVAEACVLSRMERTFRASARNVNGFCRKPSRNRKTPWLVTAFSAYPDMNNTLVPGRVAQMFSATCHPDIKGITTSATIRWRGPECSVAMASASCPLHASST